MVKSQRRWTLAFSLFMAMLFLFLWQINVRNAILFFLAVGIGYTLQKSRFCFASAFRDPLVVGMTELTRAFLLLMGLSILGFTFVYQMAQMYHYSLELNVYPLGLATVVGGVLFGIGMVIAGGCVSGILMRIGEGFAMQMVAFVGVFIGAFFGGNAHTFWSTTFGEWPGIFLPDWLGWVPTMMIDITVLAGLWFIARWWQNKQNGV